MLSSGLAMLLALHSLFLAVAPNFVPLPPTRWCEPNCPPDTLPPPGPSCESNCPSPYWSDWCKTNCPPPDTVLPPPGDWCEPHCPPDVEPPPEHWCEPHCPLDVEPPPSPPDHWCERNDCPPGHWCEPNCPPDEEPPHGGTQPGYCSINDALTLGECGSVISQINGADKHVAGDQLVLQVQGAWGDHCCPQLAGVSGLEAALCLCGATTTTGNLFGGVPVPVPVPPVPVHLCDLLGRCGKTCPPNFGCPADLLSTSAKQHTKSP